MITPDDNVEELLSKYPGINEFLMQRGIVCVLCGEPFWGSLRELISRKNLDLDSLMAEINEHFGD